jgi:hypothetical protein
MQKYFVQLKPEERLRLKTFVRWGVASAASLGYARMLLLSDDGPNGMGWDDKRVAEALSVARTTVRRLRQRFALNGLNRGARFSNM